MDLIELYKSILAEAGMSSDDDGFVSMQLAKLDKKPVIVKGKRLVLPTHAQLKTGDFQNRVVFHPLAESILRGESDVLTAYREHLNKRLNFILGYTAISLLTLATSPAQHSLLSPDQTIFLSQVKDADEGTLERLIKITEAMMVGDESKSIAHIYVRRNVQLSKRKHLRVGVVSFPLYEELKKTPAPKVPNEVFGVKLRKIDRECLKGLLEYILPSIGTPEEYYSPSDSEVAPTLDALMRTVIKLGDPINGVLGMFGKFIDGAEDLTFTGDWEAAFNDLPALIPKIRMIPPQAGNEGRAAVAGGAPIVTSAGQAPAPQEAPAPAPAPVVQVPRGLGADSARLPPAPVPAAPAVGYQAPYQPPMGHQQPWAPQPQYHAPQPPAYQPPPLGYQGGPQQPAEIRRTANGVDFNSFLQANPALAAQVGAYRPYGQPQMGGFQQPYTPRFAQAGSPYGQPAMGYGGMNGPGI